MLKQGATAVECRVAGEGDDVDLGTFARAKGSSIRHLDGLNGQARKERVS
jgi:hypothetical protein